MIFVLYDIDRFLTCVQDYCAGYHLSLFRKEKMNLELHYQLHLNTIYSQSFSIRAGRASRIHVARASEFLRGMLLNSGTHKLRRLLKQGQRM